MIIALCTAMVCAAFVAVAHLNAKAETDRQERVGRLFDALADVDAALEDVRAMGLRVDAAERTVTDGAEKIRKVEGRLAAIEMKVNGR